MGKVVVGGGMRRLRACNLSQSLRLEPDILAMLAVGEALCSEGPETCKLEPA